MVVEVLNYLDDLGGADVEGRAQGSFEFLRKLLKKLGFAESGTKACSAATRMIFLGMLSGMVKMVMEMTPERVHETLEVRGWATRETTSRKKLQVLLGKLHFVCKCVIQGRVFVSLLLTLCETSEHGVKSVSEEARADIRWFEKFLPEFNGVALVPDARWSEPDAVLVTDACLVGCWGVCDEEFFQSEFPVGLFQFSHEWLSSPDTRGWGRSRTSSFIYWMGAQ